MGLPVVNHPLPGSPSWGISGIGGGGGATPPCPSRMQRVVERGISQALKDQGLHCPEPGLYLETRGTGGRSCAWNCTACCSWERSVPGSFQKARLSAGRLL